MVVDPDSPLGLEIAAFERARQAALVSGDVGALNAVLHDDLLHIHSSGMVHTKSEFIAHVGRMGGFVSIERGALEIRQTGDAVILTGPTKNTVRRLETGEVATLDGFGTVVAVRDGGAWRVILSQITMNKPRSA